MEIAIAASRPPQRDSYVPDVQAGLKFNLNNWKGVATAGGTGTSFFLPPSRLRDWRRFQVQESTRDREPERQRRRPGWGYRSTSSCHHPGP